MSIDGEILVIDNDRDDLFIYESIFEDIKIPNPVRYFEFPAELLDYLDSCKTEPFLIICDINMPLINGFKLRKLILKNKSLKGRLSPFVYITNTDNEIDIFKAHELFTFGLYKKQSGYTEHKNLILKIIKACSIQNKNDAGF